MEKIAYLVMFIDITDFKNVEEAKAKEKYFNVLLATVCHEFWTPLNAMMANVTSALSDKGLSEKSKSKLLIVDKSISILDSMINDIMDVAKLEKGVFKLRIEEFSLNELLSDVNRIFEI